MLVAQKILIPTTIVVQLALWASYAILIPKQSTMTLWGRIPQSHHMYYLLMALVAYVLNLIFILYTGGKRNTSTSMVVQVLICMLVYYGMQFFFIPFLMSQKIKAMRILLALCIIPIGYLVYVGIRMMKHSGPFQKVLILVSTIVPLLHVAINDYALYSLRY